MTKQDYAILKQAGEILERLSNEDAVNPMLPNHYRNSLTEASDHYSQMMYSVEKDEEAIVVPGFWNDELKQVVESDMYRKQKEKPYLVDWKRDNVNEWELSIVTGDDEEDSIDDMVGLYHNYLDEEQVKEDLKLLIQYGYKINLENNNQPFTA